MKDKIEVGEYVRDKEGNITKIINTLSLFKDVKLYLGEDGYQYSDNSIVKHSKNIFELLENEDIVILEYYVSKYRKRITRRFEIFKIEPLITFGNMYCDFLYDLNKQKFLDGIGFNPKIKRIVTKEQFSSIEHKV